MPDNIKDIVVHLNLNQQQLLNAVLQKLSATPGDAVEAQIWYDSTQKLVYFYNGTEAIPVGYLPPATAQVLGGVKIGTNVNVAADGTISINTASNSQTGVIRIATDNEATAGTSTTLAINPYQLVQAITTAQIGALIYKSTFTITNATDYSQITLPVKKGYMYKIIGTGPKTIDGIEWNPGDYLVLNSDVAAGGTITSTVVDKIDNTEAADIVRLSATQTLTNKTINADNNTITDLETDNFKSGVIVTEVGSTGTDTSLPTEQAVREALTALDNKTQDKVTTAVENNIATWNASGNTKDSGKTFTTSINTTPSSASNNNIPTEKAVSTQLDTKVNKTSTASQLYGTASANTQTTITYTAEVTNGAIVQRGSTNGQIAVPLTPTADAHAASKKYVDDIDTAIQNELDTKVDKTNGNSKIYGTTNAGVQTTYDLDSSATANTIAYRSTGGTLNVGTPTANAHATTKKYVDDINSDVTLALSGKVDKTDTPMKIYGTDSNGDQTTVSYSNTINASYLVQRDANAQVIVPEVPIADENAASKKYVDGGLALKPDTTSLDDVAFSGDYNDLINTPTFKTINSGYITGTGDIPLQTPLSGTNGNVVTYTATTGTLGELGFDNTPTQNSNKLVKSGPIWTELQKKVNITDIKNNLTSADTDKPLSAYQGKVLDEKITLAQQSTHDRGVVLNALTSQGQNYTITAASINAAGTNYTVGDTLFLTSDMAVDAIINVLTVDSTTGAITSISLGQGGAFTTAPTSPSSSFVGGTGTGAKFTLTTTQVNNSTLSSILNVQPNDFATVLEDEIHNDLRYVWKYADIDGDGTYEWVAGYPITNIERNFYNDPIQDGELATNAVTTVKIANNNVTAEKIADDAILGRHISTGAVTDDSVASGANIQQSKIQNLTTDLASKVDKTSTAYQIYGTAAANTQTTISYTTSDTASTIVERDANKQINIALTPTANSHATSKKYVNDQDALKVDKVSGSKRVYGTDANGNQTTYDYDSFGKVDDVKVGTTSVVTNKIATLGTMAGEEKDDYVRANTPLASGNTKCKITYDDKGLVTAGADLTEGDIPNLHISKITDITADASEINKLHGLATTQTELGYVEGVTSSIQTQLNNKQATVTGAATTIVDSNLTTSRALISNSSGKVAVSTTTSTELGYVHGVTSNIQTQLNSKQATLSAGKGISITNNTVSTDRARVAFVAWTD